MHFLTTDRPIVLWKYLHQEKYLFSSWGAQDYRVTCNSEKKGLLKLADNSPLKKLESTVAWDRKRSQERVWDQNMSAEVFK